MRRETGRQTAKVAVALTIMTAWVLAAGCGGSDAKPAPSPTTVAAAKAAPTLAGSSAKKIREVAGAMDVPIGVFSDGWTDDKQAILAARTPTDRAKRFATLAGHTQYLADSATQAAKGADSLTPIPATEATVLAIRTALHALADAASAHEKAAESESLTGLAQTGPPLVAAVNQLDAAKKLAATLP